MTDHGICWSELVPSSGPIWQRTEVTKSLSLQLFKSLVFEIFDEFNVLRILMRQHSKKAPLARVCVR